MSRPAFTSETVLKLTSACELVKLEDEWTAPDQSLPPWTVHKMVLSSEKHCLFPFHLLFIFNFTMVWIIIADNSGTLDPMLLQLLILQAYIWLVKVNAQATTCFNQGTSMLEGNIQLWGDTLISHSLSLGFLPSRRNPESSPVPLFHFPYGHLSLSGKEYLADKSSVSLEYD